MNGTLHLAQVLNQILTQNKLIGLPTETVYGLAAPINRPDLIEKIFSVKERPFFDPLIIHVSSIEMAKQQVQHWPEVATRLANAFWPGPLSIILEKNDLISNRITSGLKTVAIRCPNHPLALNIISELNIPLAAPSANKFGKTSPTCAKHVSDVFGPQDVHVFDGGLCQVGIESTIVKIEENKLIIMRQGMILQHDLEKCVGKNKNIKVEHYKAENIEAPGQIKHHYMPSIPVIKVPNDDLDSWTLKIKNQTGITGTGVLLKLGDNPNLAARDLYSNLRLLAATSAHYIAWSDSHLDLMQLHSHWHAILDRLNRASSFCIEK